jgi:hypothetical protein
VRRTFATDGQQRIAVREADHIRILSVRDAQRGNVLWTRPDP